MHLDRIYIAVLVISFLLLNSCKKDSATEPIRIEQVQVDYSEDIGLSARLKITVSGVRDLVFSYYAEGGDDRTGYYDHLINGLIYLNSSI